MDPTTYVPLSQSPGSSTRAVLQSTGGVLVQHFSLGTSAQVELGADELATLLRALPLDVLSAAVQDRLMAGENLFLDLDAPQTCCPVCGQPRCLCLQGAQAEQEDAECRAEVRRLRGKAPRCPSCDCTECVCDVVRRLTGERAPCGCAVVGTRDRLWCAERTPGAVLVDDTAECACPCHNPAPEVMAAITRLERRQHDR